MHPVSSEASLIFNDGVSELAVNLSKHRLPKPIMSLVESAEEEKRRGVVVS